MGETLPFAVNAVRPSVVQIRLAPPGEGGVVLGTGFILHAGGYALTAKHVTEAASREIKVVPTGARLLVGLATPNIDTPQLKMRANFELLGCEVVEEDARHDLALLKLTPNPFETGKPSGAARVPGGGLVVNGLFGLAPLTIERPRDGASIAVSGYPMLEPTLVTTSGIIASAWGTDLREVVPPGAASGFTIPDMADSYLADVAVNPGNSGDLCIWRPQVRCWACASRLELRKQTTARGTCSRTTRGCRSSFPFVTESTCLHDTWISRGPARLERRAQSTSQHPPLRSDRATHLTCLIAP
jgi:Trypsin-like peptidase domain